MEHQPHKTSKSMSSFKYNWEKNPFLNTKLPVNVIYIDIVTL